MVKGYLIVNATVHDVEACEGYKKLAAAAIAQYGGSYVVRGGAMETLEGQWTGAPQVVIVEFDSVEQAKEFYDSPEYRAAREARAGAADMNMIVVEGFQ
jgi:uncharacterized protein (DUF1330 family)